MSLEEYASETERRMADALIDAVLERGMTISVHDGGEWVLKRSTHRAEIRDALASTDNDTIKMRHTDGSSFGSVWLVWGNGIDLFADWSASGELDDMVWDIINAQVDQ